MPGMQRLRPCPDSQIAQQQMGTRAAVAAPCDMYLAVITQKMQTNEKLI